MAVFSGKYGAVNGISTVRNWTISGTSTPAELRASNTQGGTVRREGIYDATGSFEGMGAVPPVMPGEYFDFVGFTAPTTGAYGTAGVTKSLLNAIVEEVVINWNWENGEILNWALRFAAGEPNIITEPIESIVTDLSAVNAPIVCGTRVTLTAGDTLWPNLTQASLTITADNPTFVNSSTISKTGRRQGTIDWTAAITEQSHEDFIALIAGVCVLSVQGGDNLMKIFVDNTDFWDLKLAHMIDTTDLRVDNDTGEIIQQTHNFGMNADNQGVLGTIGRPGEDGAGGGDFWWPTTYSEQLLGF